MIIQHLNWLAVAVSAIAYFALGAIWFNPKVFGTIWMQGHGIANPTEEDKKRMPMMMATTFVLCFIAVIAMAYFSYAVNSLHSGPATWMRGVKIGAIAGVGFTSVGIAMNHIYTRKSFTLIFIDSAYHVVGMIVSGIILSVWR
ncbi:MAG: DUF1761 domain-containing protein [Bacteroidia bacterium]